MLRLRRILIVSVVSLAVLGVVLTLLGILYRPLQGIPAGRAGRLVELSGVRLRVTEAGAGSDLLFLHGSPGLLEDWDPVATPLSGRYHVVAYDRAGHGFSEPGLGPHDVFANAETAHALIVALGLRHPVVVGHSFGARTALALAETHPEDAVALVLVGTSARKASSPKALYRLLEVPYLGTGAARLLGPLIGSGMIASGIHRQFGPNQDRIPPGFIEERAAIWVQPKITTALAEESVSSRASIARMLPGYGAIHVPVFVVNGAEDPNNPGGDPGLGGVLPGVDITIVPSTGHYVQFVHPEIVMKAIDRAAGG
jgi:pimeloyl-ACP methyl ester carboxylesterase